MKTFYEAIYEWVAENFGQSEADDPSWNIEALADHLSKSDINPDELNANTLTYDEFDKAMDAYDCNEVLGNPNDYIKENL